MTPEARVLNNHLVIPTANPGQLRTVFPQLKEATVKGTPVCAVPFGLDEARILNNLGIKAPSPIRTQYDWPGRFRPRWYQIDTAEFFTLNPRAFCLSSMRTGKTLSALWASDYLRRSGKVRRVLIAAPLSTLERVWADNIFEHFPLRTFAVLHGSRTKRLELLAKPHDYYIINHDGMEIVQEALAERDDIDLIILDESAVFRNAKTKRWKTLNHLLNRTGINRSVWGLTGTPTPNEPTDAFAQCKLIKPENYKGHFTSFKNETMFQVSQFKWLPRKGAENIVNRALKPSIRFTREVCTDMEPQLIERHCELSAEQHKAYRDLLNQAVTEIRGSAITAVNAAVLISKLVQTACGCVLDATGAVVRMDFGPRLSVLEELIEENDEKVLVFVPFTGPLDAVAEALRKRWSVEVVDGGVSKGKRDRIFQDFQTLKDPHVIVAHPATMAHGLDLTAASLIIWYAPHTKHEEYVQACARIDGSKQKAKIDIAHIYATAEERRIYAALREKGRLQDVVLDLVKNNS